MEMISFEQAYDIVINSGSKTGTEVIPFTDSLNRILASDVFSDIDLPPFNKATVDGFACRRPELGNYLEIIETIAAGQWPVKPVEKMQCSRIMTGAPVPSGADCVIMVEETEILPSGKSDLKDLLKKRI